LELIQPYIGTIVDALVGVLVVFVLGIVAMLRVKVTAWLETRTTAQQREILHRLATEAMALAESEYKDRGGPAKLDAALMYVIDRAAKYGINVGMDSIRAAIEKAVLDYNARTKPRGDVL
jgi:hypothetical protein